MNVPNVAILEARALHRAFGGYSAVAGVSITVRPGSIHALIGPNGAGKTTLFNLVTGVLAPTHGAVLVQGQDVTGSRPDRVARLGVVRTFQSVRLFPSMTALENVRVGRHIRSRGGFAAAMLRVPFRDSAAEAATRVRANELLEFVGLNSRRDTRAADLALADQRRLEIARALASDPKLLLLDEPVAGMNPVEVHAAGRLLLALRDQGITILLTEHHMRLVMEISDIVTVLNYGHKIAEGTPTEVRRDKQVQEAYLGAEGAR